jgi:hypothetical protein
MKKSILTSSALVLGLAVASPAFAQNMQGPGAVNYGAGASPQTGGIPNTQVAPSLTPSSHGSLNNGSLNNGRKLYNQVQPNQTGAGGVSGDNNNGGQRTR